MNETTSKVLDFIPSMSAELSDIVTGEPTTVDRLHLAAAVCGWITDYPEADTLTWARSVGDRGDIAVAFEAGVEAGDGFALAVEWRKGEPMNAIYYAGYTADELADIGRAFLNAAIAKHRTEQA